MTKASSPSNSDWLPSFRLRLKVKTHKKTFKMRTIWDFKKMFKALVFKTLLHNACHQIALFKQVHLSILKFLTSKTRSLNFNVWETYLWVVVVVSNKLSQSFITWNYLSALSHWTRCKNSQHKVLLCNMTLGFSGVQTTHFSQVLPLSPSNSDYLP
jgi:hypothetical protein